MMGGRKAKCLHLPHSFLRGPSLLGHSIRCDHHPGAVVTGLAVDENLFPAIFADQCEEPGYVGVFWMEAVPRNRNVTHPESDYLLALPFNASFARVHNDPGAHPSQFLKSGVRRLSAAIQRRVHLAKIWYALDR
jgi:hypothetical protein